MNRRPAVFLDRDGVLNHPVVVGGSERPPWDLEQLVLIDGAADALRHLHQAGFVLVGVTNQPDIGRGLVSADAVDAVNRAVASALDLDAVYVCPHGGSEPCGCRKPAPGMLLAAERDHDLDLAASWMIGDRWVDIAAAVAAGVRAVLIERPGSWAPTSAGPPPPDLTPLATATGLLAAVEVILDHPV